MLHAAVDAKVTPAHRLAQILRDLDSPLIFRYDVLTPNNDNGVLERMVEHMTDHVGRKPDDVLVDAGYVSVQHLEFGALAGVTW